MKTSSSSFPHVKSSSGYEHIHNNVKLGQLYSAHLDDMLNRIMVVQLHKQFYIVTDDLLERL